MEKILKIIIFILFLVSCDRKPLYLSESARINITISVKTNINDFWYTHDTQDLIYKWDGIIGYSEPNCEFDIIFLINGIEVKRVSAYPNVRTPIDIEANTSYDVIIHNKTDNVYEKEFTIHSLNEDCNINNNVSNEYITYKEPGEIFHTKVENMCVNTDIEEHRIEYVNGTPTYVMDFDFYVTPISYIYIIQFIIVNDDGTQIEAKEISDFTISGISTSKSLITLEQYNNQLSQVVTKDIKDGQYINSSLVFASRITLLGVNGDSNGSWGNGENNFYYTIVNIPTYNYGDVTGVVDITNQLKSSQKGGIITIRIKNSDLKKGDKSGYGFGVTVQEWREYIQDIPF